MSIILSAIEGKITWAQAAAQVGAWEAGLIGKAPAQFQPAITAAVSDVKQGVSNAIDMADGALGPLLSGFLTTGVPAFEEALSIATHGASAGFNPLISDGIDRLAAAAKSAIDAAALQAKAVVVAGAVPNTLAA